MTNRYCGDWKSYEDVLNEFARYEWVGDKKVYDAPRDGFPTDAEIIVAGYITEPYSGAAHIFYQRDGEIYEYSDSHCSCDGLNWYSGGKVTKEYIRNRILNGYFSGLDHAGLEVLKALVEEPQPLTDDELLQAYSDSVDPLQ